MLLIKKIIGNNLPLKIVALASGTLFWYLFGHNLTMNMRKTVPLCFYNVPAHISITAPEEVTVELAAKRAHLYALNNNQLAVHIDAHALRQGEQIVTLTNDSLFLPPSIKLVHYEPSLIAVQLTHNPHATAS
jgi:hypothetical protein